MEGGEEVHFIEWRNETLSLSVAREGNGGLS